MEGMYVSLQRPKGHCTTLLSRPVPIIILPWYGLHLLSYGIFRLTYVVLPSDEIAESQEEV